MLIRIISTPPGGAPDYIRKQWIGLSLPATRTNVQLGDVLTRLPVNRIGGFAVRWGDAMAALGKARPGAEQWWRTNVLAFLELIFTPDCCEILED